MSFTFEIEAKALILYPEIYVGTVIVDGKLVLDFEAATDPYSLVQDRFIPGSRIESLIVSHKKQEMLRFEKGDWKRRVDQGGFYPLVLAHIIKFFSKM